VRRIDLNVTQTELSKRMARRKFDGQGGDVLGQTPCVIIALYLGSDLGIRNQLIEPPDEVFEAASPRQCGITDARLFQHVRCFGRKPVHEAQIDVKLILVDL